LRIGKRQGFQYDAETSRTLEVIDKKENLMATTYVPVTLRKFSNGQSTVEFPGSTIAEVLDKVRQQFPDLDEQLYSDVGELKPHIAVFVNDTNIRDLENEATPIRDRDEIFIVTAIAGG
jgi:sulfur-carrier protein